MLQWQLLKSDKSQGILGLLQACVLMHRVRKAARQ